MPSKNGINPNYLTDFNQIPTLAYSKDVEMPEWTLPENLAKGAVVTIIARAMSESERLRFLKKGNLPNADLPKEEYALEMKAREDWFTSGERDIFLVQLSFVKPDGSPLFSPSQVREIFERPDPRPWMRMVSAAEDISLITNGSIEEFRKNSMTPKAGISELPKPSGV